MHEIKLKLSAENCGYFVMNKIVSSFFYFNFKRLSKNTNKKLYFSYFLPIVMFYCETCSMTKDNETKLLIFERKVFRRIYDLTYNAKVG